MAQEEAGIAFSWTIRTKREPGWVPARIISVGMIELCDRTRFPDRTKMPIPRRNMALRPQDQLLPVVFLQARSSWQWHQQVELLSSYLASIPSLTAIGFRAALNGALQRSQTVLTAKERSWPRKTLAVLSMPAIGLTMEGMVQGDGLDHTTPFEDFRSWTRNGYCPCLGHLSCCPSAFGTRGIRSPYAGPSCVAFQAIE